MTGDEVGGYRLVLPPGWRRIPVRSGSAEVIRQILDERIAALPRNLPRDRVAKARAELEGRLRRQIAAARQASAVDLYLPVDLMHGALVGASFLVSEGPYGAGAGLDADPMMVVASLAAQGGGASLAAVGGVPAVRTERAAPADPAREIELGSRRVDYVVPVPGRPGRWLMVAFSTVGGGDPADEYADILVELFDAMMTTFRWTRPDAVPPGPAQADALPPGRAQPDSVPADTMPRGLVRPALAPPGLVRPGPVPSGPVPSGLVRPGPVPSGPVPSGPARPVPVPPEPGRPAGFPARSARCD